MVCGISLRHRRANTEAEFRCYVAATRPLVAASSFRAGAPITCPKLCCLLRLISFGQGMAATGGCHFPLGLCWVSSICASVADLGGGQF